MAEDEKKCFFCDSECQIYYVGSLAEPKQYNCKYCGIYKLCDLPGFYDFNIRNLPSIKFKMACLLGERRLKGLGGVVLAGKTATKREENEFAIIPLNEILDEFPKKAGDFIVRALLNLSRLVKHPFERIELNLEPVGKYNLFAQEGEQASFFLRELENQGWISSCSDSNSWEFWTFTITAKCWEMIDNLQQSTIDSKRVFVAMWFDKSMDDYYRDGIKKAIEEAGYVPVRIDLKDFNEKICDEIIAEIRRAKFMIADYSEYRTGVFFEAGFAKGLGREVIFTVSKEYVDKLKEHFDTRQYNHIVYDSPEDLRKKLYNRIGATIV
jgi:hypothetical protein